MINLKRDKTFTSLAAALGLVVCLAAMPAKAQIVTSGDTFIFPEFQIPIPGIDVPGDFTIDGGISIGIAGPGTLLVENGSTLTSNVGDIGGNLGGGGIAIVRGALARWTLIDLLLVGREDTGSLVIDGTGSLIPENEPIVDAPELNLGFFPGSSGYVTVKNSGRLKVDFFSKLARDLMTQLAQREVFLAPPPLASSMS